MIISLNATEKAVTSLPFAVNITQGTALPTTPVYDVSTLLTGTDTFKTNLPVDNVTGNPAVFTPQAVLAIGSQTSGHNFEFVWNGSGRAFTCTYVGKVTNQTGALNTVSASSRYRGVLSTTTPNYDPSRFFWVLRARGTEFPTIAESYSGFGASAYHTSSAIVFSDAPIDTDAGEADFVIPSIPGEQIPVVSPNSSSSEDEPVECSVRPGIITAGTRRYRNIRTLSPGDSFQCVDNGLSLGMSIYIGKITKQTSP